MIGLVGRIGPVGRHIGTLGEVHKVIILLAFPISAINFQCKVMKLSIGFEVGEIKETVLDMFGKSFLCYMSEGSIILLGVSGG